MPRLHSAARGTLVLLMSAVLAVTGASAAAAAGGAASSPSASTGTGTLSLSLASPAGAPTVVTLTGPATFAHSTETGGATGRSFKAPAGTYSVGTPDVVVKGLTYRASVAQRTVAVKRGRTTSVTVTYLPAPMGADLHVTSLTGTSVGLAWSPPPASVRGRTALAYAVRRSAVDAPPLTGPTQGTAVPVKGTTSTDSGLTSGSRYRYSLFTQSQYGWNGPVELEVGTAPPAGSTDAAYALAPNAVVLEASNIASASPTGSGVHLRVRNAAQLPAVGTAVVLPISAELAGGFLGVVTSVAADGAVELTAGGLSDAFDFYALPPTAFSSSPGRRLAAARVQQDQQPDEKAQAAAAPSQAPSKDPGQEPSTPPKPSKASCERSGDAEYIDWSPRFGADGTFEARVDKIGVKFGPDIVTGAHVSMDYGLSATAQAAIEVNGSFACELALPTVMAQITTSPVPIAVLLDPVAEAEVKGAARMAVIGVRAEARTRLSADFKLPSTVAVDGGVTLSLTPLAPELSATADFTATVGGDLLVGPGAGTVKAGVIAGIGGRIHPLEAAFTAKADALTPGPKLCLTGKYGYSNQAIVSARAWVASKQLVDETIPVPQLQGGKDYPGSPFDLPEGCSVESAPEPALSITTDRLGEGVTGVAYSSQLAASTEDAATWSLVSGTLPQGLVLDPSGRISGTPTTKGESTFTIKVATATGVAQKTFALIVRAPLPAPVDTSPVAVQELVDFVGTYFVCGGSCTSSWGDPHLTTVDGVHYDYQGVGEFVAARSGSGAAEVQVRQQPWGSSRLVSVNTAVAARVGEHRLAVYRTGAGVDVRLDGQTAQLTQQARSLGTAGQVVLDTAGRVLVTWADGSALAVGAGVPQALDLQFLPGTAVAQGMTGLLAAGAEKAAPVRASAATSLFDYAAGESTATFTDPAFPYGAISVGSLPAAQKQAAIALCSGVGVDEKALLDACVLDVAVTGEPRFAVSAAESQAATSSAVVASSAVGDPWRDAAGRTGTAVLTYDHVGCTAVDAAGRCTGGVWGDPVPGVPFTWSGRGTTEGQGDVTFTKTFTVTGAAAGRPATMTLWADQEATATVNGKAVPRAVYPAEVSAPVTLRAGENTVTVVVSNLEGFNPTGNPAGLAWRIAFDDDSTGGRATIFDIRGFSSTDAVQISGDAKVADRKLRLTDSYGQRGYAWYGTPVSTTRSFSTTFEASLASDSRPGDGMALVFQSDPRGAGATGGGGGGLGYDGIRPLVGVELDTFGNSGSDPDSNHVAIVVDGAPGATGAVASLSFPLVGEPLVVRIDYDATAHRLEVFVGHDGVVPQEPTVAATVDLSGLGAKARAGFTASTGAAYEVADVSRWSFGGEGAVRGLRSGADQRREDRP